MVKVLVQPAINIWVGLPSDGSYNDRFMALGGGGFVGTVKAPEKAVKDGFAGAGTDTGHSEHNGKFGMLSPGVPNVQLQIDFSYRSEHLMAVVGKRLIEDFYGRPPIFSYWNGCSTGGRQGNMMAQKYPDDYQGILAGAPAVHFEKLGLGQMWPQVPMLEETGSHVASAKQQAAVAAAVDACDALDGVVDKKIRDPRACTYDAIELLCPEGTDNSGCLTPGEAAAINRIWDGPTNMTGDSMWYGIPRGASLGILAGSKPFSIADEQAKYWIYLDPDWDYRSLSYANWQGFFDKTVQMMEPTIGTDDADYRPFRDAGHKLLLWHGWADNIIMPQGTIDLYNAVVDFTNAGDLSKTQDFARLYMAPGVQHCGMDTDVYFEALVAWVENGTAPDGLVASKDQRMMGLLCPHPEVSIYKGSGSADDAENFECGPNPGGADTERINRKINGRIFGKPFLPPPELAFV